MITQEEKKRMDAIMEAFRPYIAQHNYFDILYSDKIGYVRLLVDEWQEEEAVRIRTAEQMLHILFNEIILDVVLSPDRKRLSEEAKAESQQRIENLLKGMGSWKIEARKCLEDYMKNDAWSKRTDM